MSLVRGQHERARYNRPVETFTTAITEYTIRDDGIVIGRDINPATPRTVQSLTESFDRLADALEGKRPPGLWDARSVPEFPLSVWQVFVNRVDKVIGVLAILVDDRVEDALGAFPAAMDSMLIPVRLFHREDEATQWLLQFVDEDDPEI